MFTVNDFNTSVRRALTEIDPLWPTYPGIVICGTHTPEDVEMQIRLIAQARVTGTPYLGICFGYQLAAVEYARNVLGITDACSSEWGEGTPVVQKLPELKVGLRDGENYWHNYEVTIEWEQPDNFFVSQFHPEYNSWKGHHHPLLVKYLNYARLAM